MDKRNLIRETPDIGQAEENPLLQSTKSPDAAVTSDPVKVRPLYWVMVLVAGGEHCYVIADSIYQIKNYNRYKHNEN